MRCRIGTFPSRSRWHLGVGAALGSVPVRGTPQAPLRRRDRRGSQNSRASRAAAVGTRARAVGRGTGLRAPPPPLPPSNSRASKAAADGSSAPTAGRGTGSRAPPLPPPSNSRASRVVGVVMVVLVVMDGAGVVVVGLRMGEWDEGDCL